MCICLLRKLFSAVCAVLASALIFLPISEPSLASSHHQMSTAAHDQGQSGSVRGLLDKDLQAFFARRLDRVDPYINWYFSWHTSYANSYVAVAKVVMSVWQNPQGWQANVIDVLNNLQLRNVRDRVLEPDDDAVELLNLIERHARSRLLALEMRGLTMACPSPDNYDCRNEHLKRFEKLASETINSQGKAASKEQEIEAVAKILGRQDEATSNLLHTVRPLTSRIVLLVVRFTELATLVMLLSAGLRQFYVPNTVFTRSLIALGVAWGLDYGLLAFERGIYENSIRQQLIDSIETQESPITRYVTARLDAIEDSFLERVRPMQLEAP